MERAGIYALRPSWVAFGWFIAAGVTGVIILTLAAFGGVEVTAADEAWWAAFSIVAGFLVGGFFVGWRTGGAPLLHAVAIGAFSVVVWVAANAIAIALPGGIWEALPLGTTLFLLALQIAATAAGAWAGAKWTHDPNPPIAAR